jgi:hypothetical protein
MEPAEQDKRAMLIITDRCLQIVADSRERTTPRRPFPVNPC